jgi:hypothetical protein
MSDSSNSLILKRIFDSRFITLLDIMKQVYGLKIYNIVGWLTMKGLAEQFTKEEYEEKKEEFLTQLEYIKDSAIWLDFSATKAKADSIIEGIKADAYTVMPYFRSQLTELSSRFSDELANEIFFLPTHEENYFLAKHAPQIEEIAKKIPMIERDLREAHFSIVLGRYTGSVFHSMRVMEASFTIIKQWEGANFPEVKGKNWGLIIGDIEKYFQNKYKAKHGGNPQGWKKEEPYYADLMATLTAVKDAWRNTVSHFDEMEVDIFYEFDKAEGIFRAVKDFAIKLTLKPSATPQSLPPVN